MKYIIELEKLEGTDLWRAKKGAKTLVFNQYGIDHILDPYTEPTEHDGCEGCLHYAAYYTKCLGCVRNPKLTDLYEPKPKKTIKRWEQYEGNMLEAYKDYCENYCHGICTDCDRIEVAFGMPKSYCFADWLMEDIEVESNDNT